MLLPTLSQTESWLDQAEQMNPGAWVPHSRHVGESARRIAARLPGADPAAAYILGLLHDIGRREGIHGMRHIMDGYRFLLNQGYPDAARVSLTHSYPDHSMIHGADEWDGDPADMEFVRQYIGGLEYDIYDRLIQLCDSLCMSQGPVLLEKRIVDVALRYGSNEYTIPRWRAIFAVKKQIEAAIGGSVYSLLPGAVENSFL